MKTLRRMWKRLAASFAPRHGRTDADLDAEFEAHIALLTEKNISRGMSAAEARRAALLKFGALEPAKESCRDQRVFVWFEQLVQDLRFAFRMLRKSPGFTSTAILTLAVGIGASTAIFSIVDTELIRRLPYTDAQNLIFIVETMPRDMSSHPIPPVAFINEQNRLLEILSQVAAIDPSQATLTGVPQPEMQWPTKVSSDFFSVLGWHPMLGRDFVPADAKPGAPPVAILSGSLWNRAFNSDSAIIGRPVVLDGTAYTIIGVMPSQFKNPLYTSDIWLPRSLGDKQTQWLARVPAHTVIAQLASRLSAADHGWRVNVSFLRDAIVDDVRSQLLILFACTCFVWLVACTNVANLMLARGAARRAELLIRSAVGAGRARIARQLLTECLVLAAAGGIAGVAVAVWTLKISVLLAPAGFVESSAVHLDSRMLVFAAGASILAALFFGLAPILRFSRTEVSSSLKQGAATSGGIGRGQSKALRTLVGCQVALALMLAIGAFLMVRTFLHFRPVHPGFDPTSNISFMIRPVNPNYPTPLRRQMYINEVLDRLAALPNVKEVAIADHLPFSGIMILGKTQPRLGTPGTLANTRAITPNYFRVMSIPLLSGRSFDETDTAGSKKVALVSREMAERFWPGESPLGKHFSIKNPAGDFEVVGEVENAREFGMTLKRWLQYYVPFAQSPARMATFIVKTVSGAPNIAPAIRATVLSVNKDEAIMDLTTVQETLSRSVAVPRFETYLVGSFAAVALLLSVIGIHGVISYFMNQRTRELSIRIALGASSRQIIGAALHTTMLPVILGLVAGWGGALWLSRFMTDILYGFSPTDALANAAAVAVLLVVSTVASYLPARRATRVDPVVALRSE